MDEKLIFKLRKAGCQQFILGLESFSDRVLALMGKGYTAEEAGAFLKKTKNAGIRNDIAIIVGFPGETEEDFLTTLKYLRKNAAYIDKVCSLNICGMPIGSELRKSPEKYGYFFSADGNWRTLDSANTYPVRKKRYNEVILCCKELNIPVEACLDLEVFEKVNNIRV
jgi:radical SAM superfamily enzyme YgiQ (UPF0313 family)